MFASYLIIAGVLTLIAGHLTLVHRLFMRSEQHDFSAREQAERKKDRLQIDAAAQNSHRLVTAA